MNMASRREYLKTIKERYLQSSKQEKTKLLDEYTRNTKQNRKYITRKLQPRVSLKTKERKKRKCLYDKEVVYYLTKVWEVMDYPCGQRLEPELPNMIDILRKHRELNISDRMANLLKQISSTTIDRKLKHEKEVQHRKRFSATRPGSFLKDRIPVRLNDWNTLEIGNIALDLVAHCGNNAGGDYANTISGTDIATGWWEGEAIMGKGQQRTCNGIDSMRRRCPFKWKGIHPDNGSEFLNAHLWKYTQDEKLDFTRSRPNKKNDNCYVEQKNWTHIRKMVGYLRYDTNKETDLLNSLYRNELRLYKNFFQPVMKLKEKTREGGRLYRKYEKAKTPYQRILELAGLSSKEKDKLRALRESLNPAELKRNIDKKVELLEKLYTYQKEKQIKTVREAQSPRPLMVTY